MQDAIRIKNLKFSYGNQLILDIPNFYVKEGEIVFLFGPSGSGKSTLLELIAGVLQSQLGELNVFGQNLNVLSTKQLDSYRAENVGYIFQNFNLIPFLSVVENVTLPFLFQKQDYDRAKLKRLVESLGLTDLVQKSISQLSVGQQQRVAVARALLKNPKLILADEPTSALDYDHRESFLKLLFDLCRKQKTSVLFVSHDRTIEKLFDRSINLLELK